MKARHNNALLPTLFVVDADIKGFFDNIPHKLIMELITRESASSKAGRKR